jgi:hypothetical protein
VLEEIRSGRLDGLRQKRCAGASTDSAPRIALSASFGSPDGLVCST